MCVARFRAPGRIRFLHRGHGNVPHPFACYYTHFRCDSPWGGAFTKSPRTNPKDFSRNGRSPPPTIARCSRPTPAPCTFHNRRANWQQLGCLTRYTIIE
ncbi:hypothetical protein P691DRAFT_140450 [Macrolepiota fuliginosa MF-IS2]|uniref:Uncharacterized protein n=1 Tax=Macrolepiota fuliginosa MF-IS2 TaxID=1400762 RepID=A0A9P5X9G7_9AGAR|nr:hypothetical protein P691DRAFT_140450 [Macrolepiota fuliginosa MF-IS2]